MHMALWKLKTGEARVVAKKMMLLSAWDFVGCLIVLTAVSCCVIYKLAVRSSSWKFCNTWGNTTLLAGVEIMVINYVEKTSCWFRTQLILF
jgi:hypothetical protein